MDMRRPRHWVMVAAVTGALVLAALPSTEAAASEPLEATRTRDGVRMTMTLDGPLIAGQPTQVRRRVTNAQAAHLLGRAEER